MALFTDSLAYAHRALPRAADWSPCQPRALDASTRELLNRLRPNAAWLQSDLLPDGFANVVLVEVAEGSQFDVLRDLISGGWRSAGNAICLAGMGTAFHGYRDRPWSAVPGNLHASMVLTPGRRIPHFGAAFMALPAIAAAQAVEAVVPATSPVGIKWVNDLVIGDAKIAGIIAHTRSVGDRVDQVLLGLGLNVEVTPEIDRSPFVPRAGSLREFAPEVTEAEVLPELLRHLAAEYAALLADGPATLLSRYAERSVVVGQDVEIHPDATDGPPIAGRVVGIGPDLELLLEGQAPVVGGRLLLPSRRNGP